MSNLVSSFFADVISQCHTIGQRPNTDQRTVCKIKFEKLSITIHFFSTNYHIFEKINSNYVWVLLTDLTVCLNTVFQRSFRFYFDQCTKSDVRSLVVCHGLNNY